MPPWWTFAFPLATTRLRLPCECHFGAVHCSLTPSPPQSVVASGKVQHVGAGVWSFSSAAHSPTPFTPVCLCKCITMTATFTFSPVQFWTFCGISNSYQRWTEINATLELQGIASGLEARGNSGILVFYFLLTATLQHYGQWYNRITTSQPTYKLTKLM